MRVRSTFSRRGIAGGLRGGAFLGKHIKNLYSEHVSLLGEEAYVLGT